ncbi:MAG: hypothetical protein R3C05_23830 [Pirellulaceae bacterium]
MADGIHHSITGRCGQFRGTTMCDQVGGGAISAARWISMARTMITSNQATANNGNGGGVMTVGGIRYDRRQYHCVDEPSGACRRRYQDPMAAM